MSEYVLDKFEITLYLQDNIQPTIELPEILQHKVQKAFKERYGVNIGVFGTTLDDDTIYVGLPEEQRIIVWNGYAAFDPADAKQFGFLRKFSERERMAAKLQDTLMESLRDYYIDSEVSS